MKKNNHKVVSTFNCCEITMVTVIIKSKAACVMSELEYNRIIETKQKLGQKDLLNKSA